MRCYWLGSVLFWLAMPVGWTEANGVCGESRAPVKEPHRPRLREFGIPVGVLPTGPMNSLTDVSGVEVGHRTRFEGDSIRTGVTVVKPAAGNAFLRKLPATTNV